MQPNLAESELILNETGRIYHVNLGPEDMADTIITVGDPARVSMVSKYFDAIEFTTQHREFITHTGRIGNRRISVISTGIGTPNIDIVLNELDALANIDFATREVKSKHKSLKIIRLGTAGGLQDTFELGQLVATDFAIGLDGLIHYYKYPENAAESALKKAFVAHFAPQSFPIMPYVTQGSSTLCKLLQPVCQTGMTVTCPGFYGPQNRILRGEVVMPQLMHTLTTFSHQNRNILNFEMETSAIYSLGRLLGHECCSVSAVIANRHTGQFVTDVKNVVDRMIQSVLELLLR